MRRADVLPVGPFRACLAACAVCALFITPSQTLFAAQARIIRVPAQGFHERCVDLLARQPLSYTFAAQQSLEFSIRYRNADADVYVLRRKARSAKGKIVAEGAGTYCARWDNTEVHGMTLEYHLTLHKPPKPK